MSDKATEKAEKARQKEALKLAKDKARAEKSAERKAEAAAKRAALEARVQARKDEKAQQVEKNLESFGNEISREVLGGKFVKFYDKGYVSVSAWGGGEPEKLVDVTTTADVSKKTGLGRAVVGVATVGLNIGATSNMRGDIYVSIVTEKTTHMIHVTPPSESSVKTARKIEATGKGLITRLSNSTSSPSVAAIPTDLTTQLTKLVELHAAGVLTDEEFANAKAKIIG
jgi:hypothetical protein